MYRRLDNDHDDDICLGRQNKLETRLKAPNSRLIFVRSTSNPQSFYQSHGSD
jgi:hypothetical protein